MRVTVVFRTTPCGCRGSEVRTGRLIKKVSDDKQPRTTEIAEKLARPPARQQFMCGNTPRWC